MADDVKEAMIEMLKKRDSFAVQFDISTDVGPGQFIGF